MDYLWAGMLIVGILYAIPTGNILEVSDAILSAAGEAISLCITTAGVLALWSGLMEVAKTSGLIHAATKWIYPLITFLFPKLPKNHPAIEHISLNFIANTLGLNWGATPAGIKAMEELRNLEVDRGNSCHVASNEMCTFLIINISSLQLIPINILAYRKQYGSVNPSAIIGPAIVATFINTAAAILFCKLMEHLPNMTNCHIFRKHTNKKKRKS